MQKNKNQECSSVTDFYFAKNIKTDTNINRGASLSMFH